MTQVKETDEILVRFPVPYVPQKRKMSCWYAGAKMIYRYRHGRDAKAKQALRGTDAGRQTITMMETLSSPLQEPDQASEAGTTERQWPVLATGFGLVPLPVSDVGELAVSFTALRKHLDRHGPLWCAGRFYQGGNLSAGHIIVVTGAMRRKVGGSAKDYLIFHDPAPKDLQGGDECVKQYDLYFKTRDQGGQPRGLFNLVETEGVSPVMYMPAG